MWDIVETLIAWILDVPPTQLTNWTEQQIRDKVSSEYDSTVILVMTNDMPDGIARALKAKLVGEAIDIILDVQRSARAYYARTDMPDLRT